MCSNLAVASLPSSLISIGRDAFYYCSMLELTSLPSGLTTIDSEAFRYCHKLNTMLIPESVTEIGSDAFSYCSNLTTITFKGNSKYDKSTTTAKVTKTPAKPKVVQYWVQVTSLKSKKSAENAREVLDENKITADIFTYKDKKDQLFYRVRVGPYTTKSEAEYWQSKIAKIDTFASSSSYITSTTLD
jgi:hypothetical protein